MAAKCSSIRRQTAPIVFSPLCATLPATSSVWCNSSRADPPRRSDGEQHPRGDVVAVPTDNALQLGANGRAQAPCQLVLRPDVVDRERNEPLRAAACTTNLMVRV